jgi:hypothetical protein
MLIFTVSAAVAVVAVVLLLISSRLTTLSSAALTACSAVYACTERHIMHYNVTKSQGGMLACITALASLAACTLYNRDCCCALAIELTTGTPAAAMCTSRKQAPLTACHSSRVLSLALRDVHSV